MKKSGLVRVLFLNGQIKYFSLQEIKCSVLKHYIMYETDIATCVLCGYNIILQIIRKLKWKIHAYLYHLYQWWSPWCVPSFFVVTFRRHNYNSYINCLLFSFSVAYYVFLCFLYNVHNLIVTSFSELLDQYILYHRQCRRQERLFKCFFSINNSGMNFLVHKVIFLHFGLFS